LESAIANFTKLDETLDLYLREAQHQSIPLQQFLIIKYNLSKYADSITSYSTRLAELLNPPRAVDALSEQIDE
jgi:hypothetical protein